MRRRKEKALALTILAVFLLLTLGGCGNGSADVSPTRFEPGPWEAERLESHHYNISRERFEAGGYRYQTLHISLEHECDAYVSEQIQRLSQRFSIALSPEDFQFTIYHFSWLEFITPQQFEIARGYLSQDPNILEAFHMTNDNFHFHDNMVEVFISHLIQGADGFNFQATRHYANTPIEDMPHDPRRILVAMYEAEIIMALERSPYLPDGTFMPRYVPAFGRDVMDWRE